MKVLTIVGARPQFIKAAAVSRVIRKTTGLNEIIVHTGQHFDENMSSVFFREMEIPEPDYHLGINNLSHGAMTGRMLESLEQVMINEKPDAVIVFGDTNSTLAGALAAKKINIRLAHVEAGLRSYNMKMPEEINRILTDRISDILFCPTKDALHNLDREGFSSFGVRIELVGDVMYDAALYYGNLSSVRSGIIRKMGLQLNKYILCTVHRQENTDDTGNLRSIIETLNELSIEMPVVLPLHPRTRKILKENSIRLNFEPIEPVGYFDILELLKNCSILLTDSGGMQKEAYFFKRYCLTLRNETEWTELVSHSYNTLVGCNRTLIIEGTRKYAGSVISDPVPLYGSGNASELIVSKLLN